jgi:hypothetical protein
VAEAVHQIGEQAYGDFVGGSEVSSHIFATMHKRGTFEQIVV